MFICCVVVNRRSHRYASFLRLAYETIILRQYIRNLLFDVLAHSAQTVRREQSLCSKNLRKFLQMPVRWYPSRTSGGHVENSFVFANDTGLKCISMHVSSVWYTFQQKASQQSRTANLHRRITFHNQSADLSACAGRPLADFRRLGEHSDCFENTV